MSVFSKHPFIVLWILLLPGASLWAAGKDTATRIPVLRDGSYSTQISPTQEVLTLRPGETRTFIKFFSFNTTTAASIFLVDAVSNLPDSITLGFNAGTVQGTTVTIQYRFTVADDATGGSFDVKVDFNFLNLSEEVVATGTVNHTIIIDAPAPVDDYGDDCASAASIDMGTSRTGEIFAGGDRDFFKIVAPAAGTIVVSTEGSTDTAGDLLDDGCMLIVSQDGGGKDSNFLINQEVEEGTYYVAVRTSASNQAGAYSLTFEFIPSETFVHALYFAQFANGSGFTTQINLLSLNESQPTHARMTVRDDDGNLLDLLENDTAGEAAQEMTIPASGLLVLRTTGVGELKSGAVLIESDQPLAGTIVFGGDFGLAGVDSSPLIRDRFLAPVEVNQQRQTNTGVALQNLEERSTALTFELLNSSGTVVASATGSSLKAGGHRAFFVDELNWNRSIDFRSFEGVLRVLPQGRISASVLLTRPGQLASLPVVVP